MWTTVVELATRFRDRIELQGARHGLVYPWWIALASCTATIGAALVAVGQRDALLSPAPVTASLVLIVAPCLSDLVLTVWMPWWARIVLVTAGIAWLLETPLVPSAAADVAPLVFVVVTAEITATAGAVRGAVGSAATIGVLLLVGDLPAALLPQYAIGVGFGFVVGYMLLWQMRALTAEHRARDEERTRATLDERQRVAREIHDLVAHSLSVTMLHLTGARRALEQDADVPDAIEALTEAERIGRQAMTDIRRTVGVLATEESDVRPLPGAVDVEQLVTDFRTAGLDVDLEVQGGLGVLDDVTGLGLYRVVQESLSNVVKHAPGAAAAVRIAVGADSVRLTVVNPVPVEAGVGSGGSGLTGMASRVHQLGGDLDVGPDLAADGERWTVDLRVPFEGCSTR